MPEHKLKKLAAILADYESVLVAFSGGVDSSLLLKVAVDTLKDRVTAFTEASPLHQSWELDEAKELASGLGVRHIIRVSNSLSDVFAQNPPDRCYLCKKAIFTKALRLAHDLGIAEVVDGSTADDINEYRPGRAALAELHIKSPLVDAGLTKAEIRDASRTHGLSTWNRQPLACLASRFPYGNTITVELSRRVESCETFLRNEDFTTFRVRCHGETARIEVNRDAIRRLTEPPVRDRVVAHCKAAGFAYVTVDLEGFISGSLDERLAGGETPLSMP